MRDVLSDPEKLKKFVRAAFETMDKDKSGYLERNELEAVMANVASDINQSPPTKADVDEVLRELDENKDGRISLTEFQVLMEQVLLVMLEEEERFRSNEAKHNF